MERAVCRVYPILYFIEHMAGRYDMCGKMIALLARNAARVDIPV